LALAELAKGVTSPLAVHSFDSLQASESRTASTLLARLKANLFDGLGVAEAPHFGVAPIVARLTELIHALENIDAQLAAVQGFARTANVNDPLILQDSIVAALAALRLKVTAQDNLVLNEYAKAVLAPLVARVNDALTLAESIGQSCTAVYLHQALADAITVAEFAKAVLMLGQRPVDQVTVTDYLRAVTSPTGLSGFDSTVLAEYLKAVLAPFVSRQSEGLTLQDVVSATLAAYINEARPIDSVTVREYARAVMTGSGYVLNNLLRIYHVLAESRFYAVPAENRVYAVPVENRVHAAEEK
jgi:hypothetical protein